MYPHVPEDGSEWPLLATLGKNNNFAPMDTPDWVAWLASWCGDNMKTIARRRGRTRCEQDRAPSTRGGAGGSLSPLRLDHLYRTPIDEHREKGNYSENHDASKHPYSANERGTRRG